MDDDAMPDVEARPGGGRSPLSRERVLAAALRLADREGMVALSMRKLGAELGVEAMSLYNHVPSKAALLDGIAELVWSEMELPAGDGDWVERTREMARAFRRLAHAHPRVFTLLALRPVEAQPAMRPVEEALETLSRAGLGAEMVAHAFVTLVGYVYGYALRELAGMGGLPDDPDRRPWLDIRKVPPGTFPRIVELAPRFAAYDFDEGFELGLDLMLEGLLRRLPDSLDNGESHR